MREEINALRHGLAGRLRIAAIPTALGDGAALTTPYRERHPDVQFTICSRTSIEILDAAGKSRDRRRHHLSRQRAARPREQRCRSIRSATGCYVGRRAAGRPRPRDLGRGRAGAAVPADARHAEPAHHRPAAAEAGGESAADAGIQLDGGAVLACAHRPLGERDAGEARRDAGPHRTIRAIPIVEPEAAQTIGLVVPAREPMAPLTAALVEVAREVAARFGEVV